LVLADECKVPIFYLLVKKEVQWLWAALKQLSG
jgi:hypothetical protein